MTRSQPKSLYRREFEQKVAKEAKTDLDWVSRMTVHSGPARWAKRASTGAQITTRDEWREDKEVRSLSSRHSDLGPDNGPLILRTFASFATFCSNLLGFPVQ